ncbi:Carbonic anhydrase [Lysobacter dokdonensis DS-58]|uniref:carbonic anhydrase n=1 Tax=Lysobacter dokdonensis DS-58 TaxID=1300345 RepID=A0A0A2WPB8_9GAMM|nr:carbonic anhydrase [Lysobacter dokdonensis]KGQ20582.1 Carbonic anhydrase [Lysobacter dokdonensis DS-58]
MSGVPRDSLPSSAEALRRLKAGNARFLAGQARFPTVQKEILANLAKGQHPFATILGCSDSRVPPELVFDASFGELFVIRVAGNVIDPAIAGSLQYAGVHLHTPLLVVLGHEGCGAVEAAIAEKFHGHAQPQRIALLLANITPALEGIDPSLAPEAVMHAGVEANVRWTLRRVIESPEWQARIGKEDRQAVGAIYEMSSGRVRFLESPPE